MPPQQRNSSTGEQLEPAVKHTYLCGTDEWCTERAEVSIAPNSFAQGGMRKCHKCFERTVEGRDSYSVESVAKFSMIHRDERTAKSAAFADAKMQMVAECEPPAASHSAHSCFAGSETMLALVSRAADWAQQFNRRSPPEHKVAFVVAQVLELPGRQGSQRWSSLEPLLSGRYDKFNNNAGAVLGGRVAQAFSHFTVHESSAQICICDLQGVGGTLYTDPQIHAKGGGFGDGNLGSGGIERFLASHKCNEVCAAMQLPKVEPKQRSHGGGGMMPMGGGGQPMMMMGGGGGGGMGDLNALMRGGMGAGAGMSVGIPKVLQQMMEQMMAGQMGQMHIQHGGPGGGMMHMQPGGGGGRPGGHRGGGGGGGDDELRAAIRASKEQAAADDARRLREGIAASGGGRLGGGGAQAQGPGQRGADIDLQRALEASVKQPQPGRGQPPGRRF